MGDKPSEVEHCSALIPESSNRKDGDPPDSNDFHEQTFRVQDF